MHPLALLLIACTQLPPTRQFEGRVDAQDGHFVLAVKMNVSGDTFDHLLVPKDHLQKARLAKVALRHGDVVITGWLWDSDDGRICIDIKSLKEIDP